MSIPTPDRLMKKAQKRKAEKKLMYKLGFNSPEYKARKADIIKRVQENEERSRIKYE